MFRRNKTKSFQHEAPTHDMAQLALKTRTATTLRINLACLQSAGFGLCAWWLWPESRFNYGWQFLAGTAALVSLAFLFAAIRLMSEVYQRDKVLAAYVAQGAQPKSSTLASSDAMTKAGLQ